jgi:hypothetical protein
MQVAWSGSLQDGGKVHSCGPAGLGLSLSLVIQCRPAWVATSALLFVAASHSILYHLVHLPLLSCLRNKIMIDGPLQFPFMICTEGSHVKCLLECLYKIKMN